MTISGEICFKWQQYPPKKVATLFLLFVDIVQALSLTPVEMSECRWTSSHAAQPDQSAILKMAAFSCGPP